MGSKSPGIESCSGESKRKLFDIIMEIDDDLRKLAGENLPLKCELLIAHAESRVMFLKSKLR